MQAARIAVLAAAFGLCVAGPAAAQQRAAEPPSETESQLRLEREFFVYPPEQRRDPFASLAAQQDIGPRFEDLSIAGIIFDAGGGSVALLADADDRSHRVRRGSVIGNARVLEIGPDFVTFAVENFGVVRQERLEMRRQDREVQP